MQVGKVKWFSDSKGFGFVECEGKDYFVHFKNIVGQGFKTVHDGDKVEFNAVKGAKGMEAHDVRVVV